MIYRGLTNRPMPGMPRALSFVQNVSALFPSGMKFWRVDYIQILPQGSQAWITVPESDYFQMTPFGHRTRLNQLFNITTSTGKSSSRLQAEAAAWIRVRYIAQHPDRPKPDAVRFVSAQYPVGRDAPLGYWRKPELTSFPPQNRFVMSTHRFGSESP